MDSAEEWRLRGIEERLGRLRVRTDRLEGDRGRLETFAGALATWARLARRARGGAGSGGSSEGISNGVCPSSPTPRTLRLFIGASGPTAMAYDDGEGMWGNPGLPYRMRVSGGGSPTFQLRVETDGDWTNAAEVTCDPFEAVFLVGPSLAGWVVRV